MHKDSNDVKSSPTVSTPAESDLRLLTPKSLRIPTPKSSASDSKLTADYFQGSEISVSQRFMKYSNIVLINAFRF